MADTDAPLRIRVNPLDLTAPRSLGPFRRLMKAMNAMAHFHDLPPAEAMAVLGEVDEIIRAHCETTDGSDLDAALEQLSVAQFYGLLAGIQGKAATGVVPTPSGSSPNGSRSASSANRRGG